MQNHLFRRYQLHPSRIIDVYNRPIDCAFNYWWYLLSANPSVFSDGKLHDIVGVFLPPYP